MVEDMKKTKVRFHLGAGDHFMHWQITHPDGRVEYYNPATVDLQMVGCTLKNHRRTAERIFNGENKTVCAWVECADVQILTRGSTSPAEQFQIFYNPRRAPYWCNLAGTDLDQTEWPRLTANGKNLYLTA